ncbi:unnamed protein product [Effrenium voratum]|nr:unnamed protein product [Effrenium voratum]
MRLPPGPTCWLYTHYRFITPMEAASRMRFWTSKPPSKGIVPSTFSLYSPKGAREAKLRLYSIASSRLGDDGRGKTLSLCVKRVAGGEGGLRGVCSNYLCDAKAGDKITITGPTGKDMLLPDDLNSTLIMVATGTGVAPFRAHLRWLFHDGRTDGSKFTGLAWLFLGVPHGSSLLYDDEHQAYKAQFPDRFRYSYATSRQGEKEYVQTRMMEHGDELWQLLQLPNTHLYICGLKDLERSVNELLESIAGGTWNGMRRVMQQQQRYHCEVF